MKYITAVTNNNQRPLQYPANKPEPLSPGRGVLPIIWNYDGIIDLTCSGLLCVSIDLC